MVSDIRVGAFRNQILSQGIPVTVRVAKVKGGISFVIARVDVRPTPQRELGEAFESILARNREDCIAKPIFDVYGDALVKEPGHLLGAVVPGALKESLDIRLINSITRRRSRGAHGHSCSSVPRGFRNLVTVGLGRTSAVVVVHVRCRCVTVSPILLLGGVGAVVRRASWPGVCRYLLPSRIVVAVGV